MACRTAAGLFALVAAASGCATAAPPRLGTPDAPAAAFAWQSLRAEHRVVVAGRDRTGREVVRRLRGLFFAERPDRFRVRALGPGDVTLWDVQGEPDGRCRVLEAAAAPPPELLETLCDDLRAAYRLGPQAVTTQAVTTQAVTTQAAAAQPGGARRSEVRYGDFRVVSGRPVPFLIQIQNPIRGYTVTIQSLRIEIVAR